MARRLQIKDHPAMIRASLLVRCSFSAGRRLAMHLMMTLCPPLRTVLESVRGGTEFPSEALARQRRQRTRGDWYDARAVH